MILWCDGGHGARENMARDAAMLAATAAGERSGTVLRLFRFTPAGITLGAGQRPERELDVDRVEAAGLEWAVRPTGGRAIFHDEEWTFSLVTRLGSDSWAATPAAAYAQTCALLAAALKALGVPAEFAPGSPGGPGAPRDPGGASPPCFASSARHELTIGGGKFVGLAQRRVRETLLQQGSLLLGDSHLRLPEWQRLDPAALVAARTALARASAHAGTWLGPRAPLEDLADALARELPGAARVAGPAVFAELLGGVPARER